MRVTKRMGLRAQHGRTGSPQKGTPIITLCPQRVTNLTSALRQSLIKFHS
jgi:hypothetical protein